MTRFQRIDNEHKEILASLGAYAFIYGGWALALVTIMVAFLVK